MELNSFLFTDNRRLATAVLEGFHEDDEWWSSCTISRGVDWSYGYNEQGLVRFLAYSGGLVSRFEDNGEDFYLIREEDFNSLLQEMDEIATDLSRDGAIGYWRDAIHIHDWLDKWVLDTIGRRLMGGEAVTLGWDALEALLDDCKYVEEGYEEDPCEGIARAKEVFPLTGKKRVPNDAKRYGDIFFGHIYDTMLFIMTLETLDPTRVSRFRYKAYEI